jgi:hypothetical protein
MVACSEATEERNKTRNNVSKLDRTHSISEVLRLGRSRNDDVKPKTGSDPAQKRSLKTRKYQGSGMKS